MTLSWSTYCPTADVMGPGGPGYCSFVSLLHVIRMQPTKGSKPIFIILHLLSSHFIEQKPWRNSKKNSDFARLDQDIATPASIVHPWLKWLSAIVHQQKCQKNKYQTRLPRVCYGHKSYPSFHEVKKSTVGPVELASPSQNHSWRFPILGILPILAPVKPTTGDHKASVRNGLQIKPCWLTTHIWLI